MPKFLYRIQPTRPAMLTGGPTERESAVERHWAPVHLDFIARDLDQAAARGIELGATRLIATSRSGNMDESRI